MANGIKMCDNSIFSNEWYGFCAASAYDNHKIVYLSWCHCFDPINLMRDIRQLMYLKKISFSPPSCGRNQFNYFAIFALQQTKNWTDKFITNNSAQYTFVVSSTRFRAFMPQWFRTFLPPTAIGPAKINWKLSSVSQWKSPLYYSFIYRCCPSSNFQYLLVKLEQIDFFLFYFDHNANLFAAEWFTFPFCIFSAFDPHFITK